MNTRRVRAHKYLFERKQASHYTLITSKRLLISINTFVLVFACLEHALRVTLNAPVIQRVSKGRSTEVMAGSPASRGS